MKSARRRTQSWDSSRNDPQPRRGDANRSEREASASRKAPATHRRFRGCGKTRFSKMHEKWISSGCPRNDPSGSVDAFPPPKFVLSPYLQSFSAVLSRGLLILGGNAEPFLDFSIEKLASPRSRLRYRGRYLHDPGFSAPLFRQRFHCETPRGES